MTSAAAFGMDKAGRPLKRKAAPMTNEQAYAKAKRLTANNHHQESVLTIARHFGVESIARAVQGVIAVHKARGHMDQPMIEMMHILRHELYDHLENAHGTDVRNAVVKCF